MSYVTSGKKIVNDYVWGSAEGKEKSKERRRQSMKLGEENIKELSGTGNISL